MRDLAHLLRPHTLVEWSDEVIGRWDELLAALQRHMRRRQAEAKSVMPTPPLVTRGCVPRTVRPS